MRGFSSHRNPQVRHEMARQKHDENLNRPMQKTSWRSIIALALFIAAVVLFFILF